MELKLDLRLSQKLVMTPQLQQAIKFLQLSRLELQQVLAQQLLENPLLEEVEEEEKEEGEEQENEGDPGATEEFSEPLSPEGWEDYYESDWRSGDGRDPASVHDDFPSYDQTLTKPTTLADHLLWQLRLSSQDDEDKAVGVMLIGNIDEDGYLRTSIEEIAEESHVSVKKVDSVLSLIQTFDPIGVGARDLQECLLIQLRHLLQTPLGSDDAHDGTSQASLLELIIKNHLHDLQKKRLTAIAKAVGHGVEKIGEAVRIIENLEPKPGRPYSSDDNHVIVPDVFVFKEEGKWQVVLNDDGMSRVQIKPYYKRMLGQTSGNGDAVRAYLEEKLRGAQWIIRSLDQRNRTIRKVVESVIKFQEPFLEKGIQHLKPLVLKQVAEDVGMHESTISRVTTNKYMYCPQGTLELKFFFNAGIQGSEPGTEHVSSLTVREFIREMVGKENSRKPLKDQEIVSRLRRARGIVIARRTVAKYRVDLNIAPASQRKRLY